MRRLMMACAAVVMVLGVSALAETKSVTGELLSIMCYEGHGDEGRGEKHQACATKCVKEGYPVGVLTDDGTLYKVVGKLSEDNNAKIRELLSKRVVVSGEVDEAGKQKTIDAATVEPVR